MGINYGFPVLRAKHNTIRSKGEIGILSDLHLGSADFDEGAFLADVPRLKECQAVLVNGDIFDAIATGDHRYMSSRGAVELRGKDDILGDSVRIAVKLLLPFAHKIVLLARGNHEAKILRTASFDMVRDLADALALPHTYGGYGGLLEIPVGGARGRVLRVRYHHGSGSASGPSAALKKLSALVDWCPADLITQGHHHCPGRCVNVQLDGRGRSREVCLVQSGSYLRPHRPFTPLPGGEVQGGYILDWGCRPYPIGASFVRYELAKNGFTWEK